MTEDQIRSDIRARLPRFFSNPAEVRMVEEMEICAGKARADMTVISDQLIGIEIKSPQDNLKRLSNQVDQYSKCFDHVVLVVHESHAKKATALIPQWWGVIVGSGSDGDNFYHMMRSPAKNHGIDVDAILSLLWRSELEVLFSQLLEITPSLRESKRKLREYLLSAITPSKLKSAVVNLLRQRQEWRLTPIV